MKQIVITGEHGYIAARLRDYFLSRGQTQVRMLSLRGDGWREENLSQTDVVIHTAGIVHRREKELDFHLYYEVNRDLTVALARKAKQEGVGQFIFFSTVSVYGMDEGVITRDTPPAPRSHYGKSKLQAEEALRALYDKTFTITILRPPMVYGPGCKGNYQQLVKLANLLPVFADYSNMRSMISIDNLCAFVGDAVTRGTAGVFFPQDPQYSCTCQMIREIGARNGKHIRLLKILNPAIPLLKKSTRIGKKAFGTLIYQDCGPCIEAF